MNLEAQGVSSGNFPYRESSGGKPWWFWVLVGFGAFFFCCICTCIFTFGALFWVGTLEPENLNFAYEVPRTMTVGTESRIDIYIDNTADESQTVNTVRVDLTLLEGVTMLDAEPSYSGDPLEVIDSMSYSFNLEIAAGDSETITLYMLPDNVGEYDGEIRVCMGAGLACERFIIQYEVTK